MESQSSNKRNNSVSQDGIINPAPLISAPSPQEQESDLSLRIILDKIADLTIAMRELLMTLDRYVYFSGLIAAGALTLGVIHHSDGYNWLALVFAPYAIGLSYIYLIQIFTEIERRAGYKKFLEEQARQRLSVAVLLYSDVSGWKARNRPSTWGVQIINAFGLLGFIYLSIVQTRRYDTKGSAVFGLHFLNLDYLNLLALSAISLVIISAMVENLRESSRAYEVARVISQEYTDAANKAKLMARSG